MSPPLSGRILVTGGAGFIGSALVWALNQRGLTDIVVTDVLGSDEKWKNLVPLQFADYVEAGDFRARLAADARAFGRFTAVFHLGANSATTERNASHLIDNNFNYTKELAAWAPKDPILRLSNQLKEAGELDEAGLQALKAKVAARMDEAAAFAQASPYPDFAELTTDVYA